MLSEVTPFNPHQMLQTDSHQKKKTETELQATSFELQAKLKVRFRDPSTQFHDQEQVLHVSRLDARHTTWD